ncbi:MAG: CHASE2 domain-containing protein [Anaerolineae bacterium]|nr:CHASE2 domain-containing protein [Anaerolineae bacterium]
MDDAKPPIYISLMLIWQRMRARWGQSLWVGLLLAALLLLFWWNNAFAQLQLSAHNAYFVPANPDELTGKLVMVALDDASLARYGRTPAEWSRSVYADFIDQLAPTNPRLLAFDLIFSEPGEGDDAFAAALGRLRQNEAGTRTLMAVAGVNQPVLVDDASDYGPGLVYTQALRPVPLLAERADYLGVVNGFPDVDTRVRRQLSHAVLGDEAYLSFSLAAYMGYRRIPQSLFSEFIQYTGDGLLLNEQEVLILATDERGLWEQNFFGPPSTEAQSTFPVISFVDVVDGNFDPNFFDEKTVLVGLEHATGSVDRYPVPSSITGGLMSGLEIQANAIETLELPAPLVSQPRIWQAIMIAGLTVLSTLIYSNFNWIVKLVAWGLLALAFLIMAFLLFGLMRQTINLFYGLLAISVPLIVTIGLDINREIQRRQRSEFLLQTTLNVSQQRMVLPSILELLLKDVQKAVPNTHIMAVFALPDGDRYVGKLPDDTFLAVDLDKLVNQARLDKLVAYQNRYMVVPLVRQGESLVVVAAQHPAGKRIPRRFLTLLQDMLEQVGPDLENALLHRTIDQQNALLERILQRSPAGIVVTDSQLMIQRSNEQFATSMGLAPDETVIGRDVKSIFAAVTDDENLVARLERHIEKGGPFYEQISLEERSLQMVAAPLDGIERWVLVLSDVSELVALNELKTRMIRMASHDLKNPLARIKGYAELITMDGNLPEEEARFMSYIMISGTEMENIINDILSLEHLHSGEMDQEPLALNKLVRELVSRHEPDFDGKHQHIVLDLPQDDMKVVGDYRTLGQAISNLLSNANKYTLDDGQISVHMRQEGDQVVLSIQDNGLGIPSDSQSKIFTEFYRVRTRTTAHISGTGLGLSLVKEVVEQHGGKVWFESVEGEGSTFFMSLPLAQDKRLAQEMA